MRSPRSERSERSGVSLRGGATVVAVGGALTLAALALGAVPLVVPGVGFMLLGVAMPLWVTLAATGAEVSRVLSTTRVVEEEPLEVSLTVRRGPFGLPGAEIIEPLAPARIAVREPLKFLWGSRRAEIRIVTTLSRRGRRTFPAPTLVVSDTLGLCRVTRVARDGEDEILVLPRTSPLHWHGAERRARMRTGGASAAGEPTGAGELDGLRTYVPGSPASRIHWPALARGAGLMERRLVAETRAEPLVVLDARCEPTASGRLQLDAAVRAAGSIALELARTGGCRVLLPGMARPMSLSRELAGWSTLHTRLALIEPDADERPPSPRTSERGAVIHVAAQLRERTDLRSAERGAPRVIVVPQALAGGVDGEAIFDVSGCVGIQLATRAASRAPTRIAVSAADRRSRR